MNNLTETRRVEPESSPYQKLSDEMTKLSHLGHSQAITSWDEAVMMPSGEGESRANALAALAKIMHEIGTSEQIGSCIAEAKKESLSDDWEKKNLELIEKNFRRATCVPASLVEELAVAQKISGQAWRHLRGENDWQTFKPHLQKTFSLLRKVTDLKAEALGCDPYDRLIDEYSPGFNQAIIDPKSSLG